MVCIFIFSGLSSAAIEIPDTNENIKELFLDSVPVESDIPGQYQFIAYHDPIQTRSIAPQKAITTITIIPGNEEEEAVLEEVAESGGGSNYKYQWDNSYGIKIYSTVYYTDYGDSVSLDRVTGGYDKTDRTLTVLSQEVTLGATDLGHVQNQRRYPTNSSWGYNAPSNWVPIDTVQSFVQYLGAYYRVDVKRSASSWRVEVINNVLSEGFWPEDARG